MTYVAVHDVTRVTKKVRKFAVGGLPPFATTVLSVYEGDKMIAEITLYHEDKSLAIEAE